MIILHMFAIIFCIYEPHKLSIGRVANGFLWQSKTLSNLGMDTASVDRLTFLVLEAISH